MYRIIEAQPLPNYRLRVRFHDGVQGEVDLSDLSGQGVFAAWLEPGVFEQVSIDAETGTVVWPGGIDLCPHALYADIVAASVGVP